jgi:hypothetical protein
MSFSSNRLYITKAVAISFENSLLVSMLHLIASAPDTYPDGQNKKTGSPTLITSCNYVEIVSKLIMGLFCSCISIHVVLKALSTSSKG